LTQDQINARKYDGAKESELHFQTKNWVIESLSLNARFSDVLAEKRIRGAANNWRKPDVQALYACPTSGRTIRIAFEIQLSTTFLDVIRARRSFYLENGALLSWIFAAFEDSDRRLTKDDVFYTNNRNAFVVNEKTVKASRAASAAILGCCYTEIHSVLHGEFALQKKLVDFGVLVLDLDRQEGYYYDYRADLREAKGALAERFFSDWPGDPKTLGGANAARYASSGCQLARNAIALNLFSSLLFLEKKAR
jgi:competence CoiA-like predicted nuclease